MKGSVLGHNFGALTRDIQAIAFQAVGNRAAREMDCRALFNLYIDLLIARCRAFDESHTGVAAHMHTAQAVLLEGGVFSLKACALITDMQAVVLQAVSS